MTRRGGPQTLPGCVRSDVQKRLVQEILRLPAELFESVVGQTQKSLFEAFMMDVMSVMPPASGESAQIHESLFALYREKFPP